MSKRRNNINSERRVTDAAEYAPRVARRKMLTKMLADYRIKRLARKSRGWDVNGIECITAAPIRADSPVWNEYEDWCNAWERAITEERKCLATSPPYSKKNREQNHRGLRPANSLRSKRSSGETLCP